MAVFVHFAAQVHDLLADTDFHMQQIGWLMIIERLFDGPPDLVIPLLRNLGFLDAANRPTPAYGELKNPRPQESGGRRWHPEGVRPSVRRQ